MANNILELNQDLEESTSSSQPTQVMNLEIGLDDEETSVKPQLEQPEPDINLIAAFGKAIRNAFDKTAGFISKLKEDVEPGLVYGASQIEDFANILTKGMNYGASLGEKGLGALGFDVPASPSIYPEPTRLTPQFTEDKIKNLTLTQRTLGNLVANAAVFVPVAVVTGGLGSGLAALRNPSIARAVLSKPFALFRRIAFAPLVSESAGQALAEHVYYNNFSEEIDKSDFSPETKQLLKAGFKLTLPLIGNIAGGKLGAFLRPSSSLSGAAESLDAITGGALGKIDLPQNKDITTAQALSLGGYEQAATNVRVAESGITSPRAASNLTAGKDLIRQKHVEKIQEILDELNKNAGEVGGGIGIRIAKLKDDVSAALVGGEDSVVAAKKAFDDVVQSSLPYANQNGIGEAVVKSVGEIYDAAVEEAAKRFGALRGYKEPITLPEDLRPLFNGAEKVSMNDIINKVTVLSRSRNPDAMEAGWRLIDSIGDFLPPSLAEDYKNARQLYANFKQVFSYPAIQEVLSAYTGRPVPKTPQAIPRKLSARLRSGEDLSVEFSALDEFSKTLGENIRNIANNFDDLPSDAKSLTGKAIVWTYLQRASMYVEKSVKSAGYPRNQNLNAAKEAIVEGIDRIGLEVEKFRGDLQKIGVYDDIKTILSAYKTAADSGGVAVVPMVAFAANGKMMPLVESSINSGPESIKAIGEAFTRNPSLKSKVSSLFAADLTSNVSLKELGRWIEGKDGLKSEAIKAFMTKEDLERVKTLYEYAKSLNALNQVPISVSQDNSIASLLKDSVSSIAAFASQNAGVSQAVGWSSTFNRIVKWLTRAPDEDIMAAMLVNPRLAKAILNYRQDMKTAVNAMRMFVFSSSAMRLVRDQANKEKIEEARQAKQTATIGGFKQAVIQQQMPQLPQ
jgi:hypothetical protein